MLGPVAWVRGSRVSVADGANGVAHRAIDLTWRVPDGAIGTLNQASAMLAGLDDLQEAATRVRGWVTAKHHATVS